jgi:hypothetical protein
MKRRDALKAMAGLAATSVLGGVARAAQQAQDDDIPLPVAYRKIYPRFETLPIEVYINPAAKLIRDHKGLVGSGGASIVSE